MRRHLPAFTLSCLALLFLLFSSSSLAAQDRFVSTTGDDTANDCSLPGSPCATINYAIGQAVDGDIISVANGTYTIAATINVNKEVTISGESEAGVILDAAALTPLSRRVIETDADNVTLEDFTIVPITDPDANANNNIGFTVKAGSNSAPTINTNVTLRNISIDGAAERTPFDFHGIDNLTIENLSASGTTRGNGINITGCDGVTLSGFSGTNNAWGSIAIYASRAVPAAGRGSSNVMIDGASLAIDGAVYSQNDIDGSNDLFNTNIEVTGWDFAVTNTDFRADGSEFTFFAEDEAAALVLADNLNLDNGGNTASVIQQISTGNFIVSASSMSIQAAIDAASAGDVIEVAAGTYVENANIDKSVELTGPNAGISGCDTRAAEATIQGNFTIGTDGITIDGFEFTGVNAQIASTNGATVRSDITIINNYLHATTAQIPIRHGLGSGGGIGSVNWIVSNNKIEDIQLNNATAIVLFNTDNVTVENNCIDHTNSSFEGRRGINADGLQTADISNNSINLGLVDPAQTGANFTAARYPLQLSSSNRSTTGIVISNNNMGGAYDGITTLGNGDYTDIDIVGNVIADVVFALRFQAGANTNAGSHSNFNISNNNISVNWSALRMQDVDPYNNISLNNNSLTSTTGSQPLIVVLSDVVFATAGETVDARCNWFGSAVQADVADNVSGQAEFTPYLTNGTDDAPGTMGFQPVPFSCDGGCPGGLVTNMDTGETFCSIQAAIDDADTDDGDVIVVAAGIYPENVVITKELDIRGPNFGINPNTGVRVAEAIIVPAAIETDVIRVQASNVTIDGITIDGDNAALTSTWIGTNGADIDGEIAVYVDVANINNLIVSNNIIENVSYFGVFMFGSAASDANTSKTGNEITNNLIRDLGLYESGGLNNWGGGMYLGNSHYTNVTNNVITNVRIGIQTGNFQTTHVGDAQYEVIDGNTIETRYLGIFYNLHRFSPLTISNNTITGIDNATQAGLTTRPWRGILLGSLGNSMGTSTISNNTIDGSGITLFTSGKEGINVWNVQDDASVDIIDGSITGVETGIFLNNFEGFNSNGADGAHATISGVNVNASDIGIRLLDSPSSTTNANVQATVNNCFINSGVDGIQLEETVASTVSGTINNNSITGQSGNTINATTIANPVDATCNWHGTAVFADITANVSGSVTFVPYLIDGTDDDAGTAGFQPVAGSCVDGPVRVYSDAALTTLVNGYTTIQAAIDDATTLDGYFVQVDAGTYEEDVNINKSITLLGSGIDITTVIGQIGGDGATFRVAAPGVVIDGFTLTREGNNTSDWNNPGLNFAGIAIQGQANDAEVRNNKIIGNRTGIDVNNSNDNNIHNNVITFNRTGLLFRNQTDNTILVENDITDSWTMGILFLDASGGTNSPVQSALNSSFNDNNISGNWYGQIVDRQAGGSLPTPGTTNLKNFECNWFGTTSPVVSTMDSAEPGYGSAIPVAYGGTAVPPGGQPDILGPGSANFEYILFLISGTDDDPVTSGFQPAPLSCTGGCPGGVAVINTNTGESFCSIQDAIDDADTENGHTLEAIAGTYDESITVNKSLTINGPNAGVACGSRGAEAIVSPTTGVPFTVTADDVTINGFEITAPGSRFAINFGNTSNVSIEFNNIHDLGTTITSGNVHAIIYTVADGASTSGASITDNCFDNISSAGLMNFSASAIGILQSTSTGVLDGLNIERNTINDVMVNTADWPNGKIAYGIQINVGGGGGYLATDGEVLNAVISNNEISNLSGFISTGIGLEGNTKDAVVENNVVSDLFGRKFSGDRAGGAYDLSALKFENNRWVSTVTVQNNSFRVNTFTHDATPGLGYAVSNYVPAGTTFTGGGGGTTGEATISCNWLGSAINGEIADNASFTGTVFNKDNAVTNFVPFLVNDTDDEPGTLGFQPAPMSCIGGPVQVYDGNTFIAVYTEIQAAIDDATTLSGHTVRIASGTYVENVDAVTLGKDLIFAPGASPGCVTIDGDFTLNAGDALEIEIEGTTPCTDHDQFIVTGTTDLGGANIITPLGMYLAEAGDEIVVIDGASAISGTFAEGNFVTDGINTYYIDYMAGTDGFDVVLTKCCVGQLDLGIANFAATSPAGNKLQVFVQPNVDVVNGAYSAGVFTIRTLTSNAVTFTKLGGALSPFDYNQVGTGTDAGYTYYYFNYEAVEIVNWTAGTEYLLLTLSYDCIGDAEFELINDAFTAANNADYYQELGAAEAQGVFYQPTATSPTAVSITAANNGVVCETSAIDLSSMTMDGTAPYTYVWSGPDGYSSTDADPAPFTANINSGGTYTVIVTDANGCTAMATTDVTVLDNATCVHNVTQDNYYPTITEAIDAAETVDDDLIFVPAANWPENVVVTKALNITGANAGVPCDDAGRGAESVVLGTTVVTIASNGVTIDGFTLEGMTGIASAGFTDVSLVNNKINAKEFGINTSLVATSATDEYTIQDNCIVFSDQVFDAEGFAANPTIASAQAPATWYTDRFAPAGFVAEVFGGDSRLKHSIDAADCQSCRPSGLTGTFYNTQGRKYDISGTTAMSIELYIPADWATTGRRMAGFWGTTVDAGDVISGFPIIEFTSEDGNPRFRGWDSGDWVDLGLPTGFVYDQFYTLEIALLSTDEFMYSVGDVSAAVPANGSVAIDNVILQGHNTDAPGVTYDIYWDNFNTFCAPVANNSPTVGVSVASANGTEAVVLQDNNVDNAFYGYGMGAVNTTARTTVRGGEFTDIMQGVSIFNTLDGVNFAPSTVGVADLSMTSFSGDYPSIVGANFHSGVYAFTGGADAAAVIDIAIDNVIVSNTGKISPNSSGIHFADFSTGAGNRLNAVVTDSEISDNLNRGVYVRGVNATASVNNNEILFNGADPHGTGGNDGYGIIVNNEAAITLNNNNIINPSAQVGTDPVTAMFIGVAPAGSITAFENSINGNGNPDGSLTANTYPIAQFTATCNWWTSDDIDVVDGLVDGNVFFVPYLNDGTDTDGGARGFVPTANSCVNPTDWYVNDDAQTDDVFTLGVGDDTNPGTKRRPFRTIGQAVMTVENNTSTGPDDNTIFVDAGSYDEQVVVPSTVGGLTLQGVGPCDAIAPNLTTFVDFTGATATEPALFNISGANATIDGFQFNVDISKLSSAIIASDANLTAIAVTNNCIDPYRSTPGTSFGEYGDRNAVNVNHGLLYRVNSANPTFTFTGNRVSYDFGGTPTDPSDDNGFRAGLASDEGVGVASSNVLQTISHDIEVRFSGPGDILITDNEFNGGGVNLAEYNSSTGTVTVSENIFNGLFGSTFTSALRMRNNQVGKVSVVENNTFFDHSWGISLENYPSVTVDGNDFTPLAGATDFRHITVNTKSISSNSATITQVEINGTFTGNTFNSNGDDTGTAMAFYNHDSDDADLGFFTVGTAGSPNTFAPGFLYAVYLGDQLGSTLAATADFPEYGLGAGSDTEMACWDRDIDVQNNTFDIGSGAQLPPTMNNAERLALEVILYHLPDNPCLGELIYFEPVLVDAKVFLQGPYDSVTGLMKDDLRVAGLVPDTEPFSDINTAHPGSFLEVNNFVTETVAAPVLAATGNDAIVDWVWLELRDMSDLTNVVATRSALVQRDGDIVDLDGISGVEFPDTYVGQYYLFVQHRNHLGAMTANPIDFTTLVPIDFTVAAEPTFGATPTSARRLVKTGIYGLWAGNTDPFPGAGFNVKYNGGSNDRLPILNAVGNMTPLNILTDVYRLEDVNMDGDVKYNGSRNDRVIILQNVGPSTPLNIITQEPNN